MLAKVGKVLVNRHPTVGKELPLALHSGQWGEKAERLLGVGSSQPKRLGPPSATSLKPSRVGLFCSGCRRSALQREWQLTTQSGTSAWHQAVA